MVLLFSALAASEAHAANSSIILDVNSGTVLAAKGPDKLQHPASLTKMMTLYLTFEALRSGRLGWNQKIKVSRNAAGKVPMKLGLRAGGTITVREAVYGMIVRSANDAAAAMAEALGGSEAGFARLMTKKARALGMKRTVFRNASGLPDARQVTTARDMATLAVALLRDYPSEYKLFATKSFKFRGRVIRGHNNLMYRYAGMDGIKTGYTRASGFNLVSAVKQGNRRVVGVVLGGRTARSRDAEMAALMDRHLSKASAKAVEVARAGRDDAAHVSMPVKGVPIPRAAPRTDAVAALVAAAGDLRDDVQPAVVPLQRDGTGWQVQIAALDTEDAAMALLRRASSALSRRFSDISLYTEAVSSGSRTLYRARFVGFDSPASAASACEALKRRSFSCLPLPAQG
ncbi:peptidase M15 [Mesorhizobium sp. L-8-10]|uniref:D-alanyl-D-alanine carboxypeptidase n=1 Tax=Mesorhizobium sp. L-8-10 TaxID=2744523 RepID=UPI001925C33F|nr:D-alanyl-D-alanine carboxypeptidase [Mesorhizobium sp. L-8-10]BCH34009.1 peptidase M15 [Mesorhizobium sp. L-8-10]